MRQLTLLCGLCLALSSTLTAQAITFTGDVLADFPSGRLKIDAGGADVGMPQNLAMNVSGWDIRNVGISYDEQSDVLFIGIDVAGVAGDADGDGLPNSGSLPLLTNGGVDLPGFAGTECFCFAMDLDDDGILDIIAGLPAGQDMSAYTVAHYDATPNLNGSTSINVDPYNRFGAMLPSNVGSVFAEPSLSQPDLEFTITNFSHLLADFSNGNTNFGFLAFCGSQEDAGIGEDFAQDVITTNGINPCTPVMNLCRIDRTAPTQSGIQVTTQYGLLSGYGCCTVFSFELAPNPIIFSGLNGLPTLLIGDFDDLAGTITVIDNGVPPQNNLALVCKEQDYVVPISWPSGTTIYSQVFAYPAVNFQEPFFLSNMISFTQP